MTWTILPAGISASMALRKRMNSSCRWRCMQRPMTLVRSTGLPNTSMWRDAPRPAGERPSDRPVTAGFQRQPPLGAVERLDLRFLVDAEHDGMRRRIDIKADDVLELRHEI